MPQRVIGLPSLRSSERDDHFTDSLNCTGGCGGNGYVFQHADGFALSAPGAGLVALNVYWNSAPGPGGLSPRGAQGDNVASSFPPAQPGYTLARVEGYVYDPALPQPAGTLPLKVRREPGNPASLTTLSRFACRPFAPVALNAPGVLLRSTP